jgi:ADP-heptose:LPS heptosyltransferase
MYETIEDFRSRVPRFTIIEMVKDVTLKQRDANYDLKKGSEILCIDSMAKDAIKNGAARESSRTFSDVYNIYSGENLDGKSIMVWRTGGIGDILFIRPILVHLKKKYPTANIMFGTRKAYHGLVQLWTDAIDELSGMPLEMESTVDRADYHLSFEGLIEQCNQAETMDVHDLFAIFAGLDPDKIEWSVPISLPPAGKPRTDKYAVIQYRASAVVRTPYVGSIVAAINACTDAGYNAVISDRPEAARDIDDIISCCKSPEMVENFAYKTTGLVDAVRLITNAALVIAPDSAQMHMAAMQGVPSIGLYGPFPGAVRCSRYPLAKWIEPPISEVCEHGGRHCFTHQYATCEGSYRCWGNMDNTKLEGLVHDCLNERL